MIHDASVEVTCDGPRCDESVYVELEFKYADYSGENGSYDSNDAAIEKTLAEDHDWSVVDGHGKTDTKHLCEQCKEEKEDE